jgi:hypothetical protein
MFDLLFKCFRKFTVLSDEVGCATAAI